MFCACVDEAIEALQHFKGEGERGQARAERLALFRDSLNIITMLCQHERHLTITSEGRQARVHKRKRYLRWATSWCPSGEGLS